MACEWSKMLEELQQLESTFVCILQKDARL
jgi:hypothetical protein